MKLRILLITAVLFSSFADAGVRSAWRNFCERHLIADAPAWMDEVEVGPSFATNTVEEKLELVDDYRLIGGRLYWISRKDSESVNQTQIAYLQSRLQALGFQIRRLRAGATGDLAEKMSDALSDYESFEVTPRR